MQCTEVKERLSEYIDGILDPETRDRMEDHLAACRDCAGELASLRELIQQLGSLDPVAPPRDFLEQLHERLVTPSRLSRILRSLFVPFRIKIPLEFAGAAVAALLVFFVFHVQQPLREISPLTQALKQEGAAPEVLSAPQVPAPAGEDRPVPLMKEQKMERKMGNGSPPIELTLVLKGRPVPQASASRTFSESAPMERGEEMDRSGAGHALSEGAFSSPTSPGRERKEAPAPASSAPRMKGRALLQEKDLTEALRRTTEIIRLAGGEIRILVDGKDTSKPPSILLDIPASRLPGLLKRLETLGTLENPPEIPSRDSMANVRIHIRFLPIKTGE